MIDANALLIAGAILIIGISIFWMWTISEKRRVQRHKERMNL